MRKISMWKGLLGAWRSKVMRLCLLFLVLGLAWWIYAVTRKSDGSTSQVEDSAMFRLGFSYVAAFIIGYVFKKFIKLMALLAAVAIGGIGLMKGLGWIQLDWASMELHVRESLAWVTGKAEAFKTFLMGYLPSTGAGTVGLWRGVRYDADDDEKKG